MKNTILILVLCLFIGSCKDSLTVNEEVDTITASIEQEDEISLFDFVSQVRLIPLETTDSSLVAHITKIITSKDKIFIYDRIQNQIFIFNREGQFISKINTWREDKFERSVANGTETVFVTLRFCVVRKQLKATLKPNAAGVQLPPHYYRNG